MVGVRLGPNLQSFHYHVPERLSEATLPGALVRMPFGRRVLEGVVLERSATSPVEETRDILELADPTPVLTPAHVELARWMAASYACSLVEAVAAMLPPGLLLGARRAGPKLSLVVHPLVAASPLSTGEMAPPSTGKMPALPPPGDTGETPAPPGDARAGMPVPQGELSSPDPDPKRAPAQARALAYVRANPGHSLASIIKATGVQATTLKALAQRGLVAISSVAVRRDPLRERTYETTPKAEPTPAQERALARIGRGGGEKPHVFLLHGITSSGKTEVYLQVIERCVAEGGRAIVLVPEIALTPQAIARYSGRFPGRVAVLHGRLSAGERLDEWEHIRAGGADVVVGSRTALFAPQPDLRLIVVDEEHDDSYKSPRAPRFNARDAAIKLGELAGARVVLGSATPDLASFTRALDGEYALLALPERVGDLPLPPVRIVDMRQELRAGSRGILSRALRQALYRTLTQGRQAILFLNRRGNAPTVLCRDCGQPVMCRRCSIALSYHSEGHKLLCHLCAAEQALLTTCPSCASPRIAPFGFGTQRVEAEVRRLFPRARVLRLDRDVTGAKDAHDRILGTFAAHKADILVGTQMVAKGHDLPLVTLVGAVSADVGLHIPDFRASERTFQLLTQAAGRAGRAIEDSQVIIQTYNPEHAAVQMAASHNYRGFYEREIAWRRELRHPPFSRMARFVYSSAREETCWKRAHELYRELLRRAAATDEQPCEVIGPAPCPISRMRGKFRWHIVARGEDLSPLLGGAPSGWTVDVDPVSWL